MNTKRVRELVKRTYLDGSTRYCVQGQEPDTAETLEADGLIEREFDRRGRHVATVVLDPDNLRVIAWQMSVNELCRAHGRAPIFHDLGVTVVDGEPKGRAH